MGKRVMLVLLSLMLVSVALNAMPSFFETVIHKGKPLRVPFWAVAAHVAHGDDPPCTPPNCD